MRLPKFKKRYLVIAAAAGIAVSAGGIAAAYLLATGTGAGTASAVAPTVTVTVTAVHFTAVTAPIHVAFTITNGTGGSVKVGKASITTVSDVTASKCGTKTPTAGAPASTIGTVPTGSHPFPASTTTKTPTLMLATGAPKTQDSCSVTFKLHV